MKLLLFFCAVFIYIYIYEMCSVTKHANIAILYLSILHILFLFSNIIIIIATSKNAFHHSTITKIKTHTNTYSLTYV